MFVTALKKNFTQMQVSIDNFLLSSKHEFE